MTQGVPMFRGSGTVQMASEIEAITRVMHSGSLILGSEVRAFEDEFAQFCGVPHCVGLANGTDALELTLRALCIAPNDKVALVANAGFYSSCALGIIGATPHYVDVDERSLNMSLQMLQEALAQHGIKAVIVTHLYGQLADIEAIAALTAQYGVPLIEDCAQAHGAALGGQRAGSFGAIGCFSFYPTKNLGAVGDGGAIVTTDPRLADRVRSLRQYGWQEKYQVSNSGGRNSRLDEMQAAVLRLRLQRLEQNNATRREIARRYTAALGSVVHCPAMDSDEAYVAHLYVIRSPRRDALKQHLAELGILSAVHYPVADHLQPLCQESKRWRLPNTELACGTVLSLPCFPGMEDAELERVISGVLSFFAVSGSATC